MARKVDYKAMLETPRAQRRELLVETIKALRAMLADTEDKCEDCGRGPTPAGARITVAKQVLEVDAELRELDSAGVDTGRAKLVELQRENTLLRREVETGQRRIRELEAALSLGEQE